MVAIGMPKGGGTTGQDGGDMGGGSDGGNGQDARSTNNQDCVPLSALAMPDQDNGDQMATPAVGDRVTYTVEGTVTSVDGDEAYVKRDSINGQPVTGQSNEGDNNAGDEDQAERGELGNMAEGMGGYS